MANKKDKKVEVGDIMTMTGEDKYEALVSLVTINNSIEVIEAMYIDFLANHDNLEKMRKEYDNNKDLDKLPFEAYCFLRYAKALSDSLKKLIL
jgi:hypothetical protein